MNPSFPTGSLVHHKNYPQVDVWMVIASCGGNHLLRSFPDKKGMYRVINGDGCNLILVVGMSFSDLETGTKYVNVNEILQS